jgi:hypothetical protein
MMRARWSNAGFDFVGAKPRAGAFDSLEPIRRAKPAETHVHVWLDDDAPLRRRASTHDAARDEPGDVLMQAGGRPRTDPNANAPGENEPGFELTGVDGNGGAWRARLIGPVVKNDDAEEPPVERATVRTAVVGQQPHGATGQHEEVADRRQRAGDRFMVQLDPDKRISEDHMEALRSWQRQLDQQYRPR